MGNNSSSQESGYTDADRERWAATAREYYAAQRTQAALFEAALTTTTSAPSLGLGNCVTVPMKYDAGGPRMDIAMNIPQMNAGSAARCEQARQSNPYYLRSK
jgi:hypothetical protein